MFYYYLLDKNNLKNYFNNCLDFSSLKDEELSWVYDFYSGIPYYLIYNINNIYNQHKFALRVNCTHMRVCADIPKLIDLCDDVLNEGLFFNLNNLDQEEDFYNCLVENNCILKYTDLIYNKYLIHRISENINSIAVLGDIDYNNTICQMIPKSSRLSNKYYL